MQTQECKTQCPPQWKTSGHAPGCKRLMHNCHHCAALAQEDEIHTLSGPTAVSQDIFLKLTVNHIQSNVPTWSLLLSETSVWRKNRRSPKAKFCAGALLQITGTCRLQDVHLNLCASILQSKERVCITATELFQPVSRTNEAHVRLQTSWFKKRLH